MFKINKLFIVLICLIVSCSSIHFIGCTNTTDTSEDVTVVDMLGESIKVKKNPKRVACLSRTTYDLLIAFGVGACIDGVYYSLLENEWAPVFDKNANDRYSLSYLESYETFILREVDIVFSPEKYITDGLKEHGIKAINVSLYGTPNYGEYVYFFADLVKQIWENEEVARRVDAWKNYMKNTITNIQTELSKYNGEKRTLYYVRGDKNNGVGYTDQKGSFTEYSYSILGMKSLNDKFETNKPSAEEICELNPDVIVVGGVYQKLLMEALNQEPYVHLDAVKNGQVFNIPVGLTMFEQLTVFSPVFLCDQANKLYPEYFNFDCNKQIIELSKEFFNVVLSKEEAQYMLEGLSREGKHLA